MLRNHAPLFAALLLLSACNSAPPATPPLAGAAIGGEFTLTGEDGSDVSWSDFDGQYRTVYFGYTYCPDVCPVDTQRAMAGLKAFEEANPALGAQIQPLFISVDPGRDNPATLTEFTDNFHPRLIGLTGTKEQLGAVTGAFAATYTIEDPSEGGGYLVGHTNITYLFGPDGEPLAMLPTDEGPEAVAAELEKWVR
ncbi:SCO family protein [Qipengyuania sp. Mu-71]|jgi:protein SCO1/2|uniref:SCO family protein n=1 Tax=Qipengyuania sp. Mu-71 TaxID=3121477 RepID=UPI002FE4CBAD